jgi:elongation factor 1 alpha-like protein
VNQRTMHKYEQESRKLGKQSFMYAWVLDETGEERNRGITMDVGRSQFETKTKHVTLLDAPGHKDFIPNMISGAGQADVALLVVDATRGEFETGFDFGGQTREHALLVRSLGVTQLAVAINKLDTVSWSKERFDEISQKLKTFLKQAGFREGDVTFVPCSGLTGQNLTSKPTENELLTWYSGPCLLEVIDSFRTPDRSVSKPFRLSVNDIFKGTGSGFCVSGRVETGSLNVGDRVMVCPSRELSNVKSLFIEDLSQTVVFAGDQATVTLSGIEMQNVSIGNVLCDPQNPVQVSSKFQARIVVFNLTVPITKGFSVSCD